MGISFYNSYCEDRKKYFYMKSTDAFFPEKQIEYFYMGKYGKEEYRIQVDAYSHPGRKDTTYDDFNQRKVCPACDAGFGGAQ